MTYRKLAVALALALTVGGTVALASSAQAAPETVCATWTARGATGAYPNVDFGGKPAGTIISDFTAELAKPAEGVSPGVEFASKNLGLDLDDAVDVSVNYTLNDGASSSSGAVRLFAYRDENADTLNDGPDFQAVADGISGVLTFTVPAGELGTLGLVYDASNNAKGSVTFSNLKVGDQPVRFTECPKPEPVAKDCEAYVFVGTSQNLCKAFEGADTATKATCAQVKFRVKLKDAKVDPWGLDGSGDNVGEVGIGCEGNPLKNPKPVPSASASSSAPPVVATPTLPITGPGLPVSLIAGGVLLLGFGGVLLIAARRRKSTFSA